MSAGYHPGLGCVSQRGCTLWDPESCVAGAAPASLLICARASGRRSGVPAIVHRSSTGGTCHTRTVSCAVLCSLVRSICKTSNATNSQGWTRKASDSYNHNHTFLSRHLRRPIPIAGLTAWAAPAPHLKTTEPRLPPHLLPVALYVAAAHKLRAAGYRQLP